MEAPRYRHTHDSTPRRPTYRRRQPEHSTLYRLVFHYHELLEQAWEARFQQRYGAFRSEVRQAFYKFLDCGIVLHGCARAACGRCGHSRLVALSCKGRGICPACNAKRMILAAEHLHHSVLLDVPHRHVVFSIPERLRALFRYDRRRHGLLFAAAWQAIQDGWAGPDAAGPTAGLPGAVLTLHTAGDLHNHNPHIHGIVTDGRVAADGTFRAAEPLDAHTLKERFEQHLFDRLLEEQLITDTVVEHMRSWPHTGFNVWCGPPIAAHDQDTRLRLCEYLHKTAVKLGRIAIVEHDGVAVVRCWKGPGTTRDYEPLEFIAQLSAQVPARWEQTVRYYGAYAARTRGKRRRAAQGPALVLGELPEKTRPSASWARLIKKVYEVDPLVCPRCGGPLKIIAFITDFAELTRITEHLGIEYRAPPPLRTPPSSDRHDQPLPEMN